MSYILDALKKIEHEKNKKTGPDGRVSISGALFQERKQPRARVRIWKTVLLIVVASLVTGAGTWFMLRGNGKKSVAVTRPAAPPVPAPVNPPAVPPPVPVTPQSQQPAVAALPAAPSPAVPAAPKRTEPVGDDYSSPREGRRSKKQGMVQPSSPPQPVQTVQAPADIKLSGIAWQDERAGRRAVVNGFLLKEGAVVSGARISDIQEDRVRFSSPAGTFEIKLDAVLPAEVKK